MIHGERARNYFPKIGAIILWVKGNSGIEAINNTDDLKKVVSCLIQQNCCMRISIESSHIS